MYKEFDSISERGGVLGAMETMYQRGKIQEESLYYETRKHDGSLPIVGINTFLSKSDASEEHKGAELIRSTEREKQDQVAAVRAFQARNAGSAPAALRKLQQAAASGGNVFGELVECVRSVRWDRSRVLCMRWGGSIAGTCKVGLTELTEDCCPRAVAKLDGGVIGGRRLGGDRLENPNFDTPRTR